MTAAHPEITVSAKANCGIRSSRAARWSIPGMPPLMADYARLAIDAGARIVGGCCGTRPSSRRDAAAVDGHIRRARPSLETIVATVGPLQSPPPTQAVEGRRAGRRRG